MLKLAPQTSQETKARDMWLSAHRVRAKHARKAETAADDLTVLSRTELFF
jgi:hypothetical protein